MAVLIIGLILFFGVHSLGLFGDLKASLKERFGENMFKAVYSLISIAGLSLFVYGFGLARFAGPPLLYDPPLWTRHLAMLLLVPTFIFVIAAYVPCRIKTALKHPMLVSVKLWAFSHLLVNGDFASVLLFGTFLVWAVVIRISLKRRPAEIGPTLAGPTGAVADAVVIVAGLVLYGLFVWKLHEIVTGVPLY